MAYTKLSRSESFNVTIISNIFIDEFMPKANGDFVKVYLYLIRKLNDSSLSIDLNEMADFFMLTERDIKRALQFWENKNLISIGFSPEGTVKEINLLPIQSYEENQPQREKNKTTINFKSPTKIEEFDNSNKYEPTREKIEQLTKDPDVQQILYVAQMYLGTTLNNTDTKKLLYIYDELKMSIDLIDFLIEYCVSKDKKSISYMQKVAINWHKIGINTLSKAKDYTENNDKSYFEILKAFGITNRSVAEGEKKYIDRWKNELGFSNDIICIAAEKTITYTKGANFAYTNTILESWGKSGIKTVSDIEKENDNFKKNNKTDSFSSDSIDYGAITNSLLNN